jgi:hypothetical protein
LFHTLYVTLKLSQDAVDDLHVLFAPNLHEHYDL